MLWIHEAANLLPLMELEAQRDLGRDVKVHGLQARAVVYVNANGERSLLDGRNRLDGMEYVGLPVLKNGTLDPDVFQEISNVDPIAYVLSANLHRRHLSAKDKRALIGNLLQAYPDKSDGRSRHSSASPTTPSPTSAANSKHVGKLPTSKTALIRRVGSSRRRNPPPRPKLPQAGIRRPRPKLARRNARHKMPRSITIGVPTAPSS